MKKTAQRVRQDDRENGTADAHLDEHVLASGQKPLQARLVVFRPKMGDVMNQRRAEGLQGQAEESDEIQSGIGIAVFPLAESMTQDGADRQITQTPDKTQDRPDNAAAP